MLKAKKMRIQGGFIMMRKVFSRKRFTKHELSQLLSRLGIVLFLELVVFDMLEIFMLIATKVNAVKEEWTATVLIVFLILCMASTCVPTVILMIKYVRTKD